MCFVLPGAILLWFISYVYVLYGKVPIIESVFYGLKPAVVAIVVSAVIRIGKKVLKNEVMWAISVLSFVAIFFLRASFPLIVFSAGFIGLIGGHFFGNKFNIVTGHGSETDQEEPTVISDDVAAKCITPIFSRTLKVCVACLACWFLPVLLVMVWLGTNHTLFHEGLFFSKAAVVTFGGAYAVLPYVAQQAVEKYQWLNTAQMIDGLGLAETTPGPLILVLQFVGFLGGWHQPAEMSPLLAASLGAFITSWVTFTPSFMFIFMGAPYIERMRDNIRMTAVLSAITAAVVGVVLNLAVWFSLNVLFPEKGVMDWFVMIVSLVAFGGLVRFKWDVVMVVIGGGLLGMVYKML